MFLFCFCLCFKVQSGHSRLATHFWAAKGTKATKRKHHSDVSWRVSFIITTLVFIFISPRFQPQTEPSSYRSSLAERRDSSACNTWASAGWARGERRRRSTTPLPCSPPQGRPPLSTALLRVLKSSALTFGWAFTSLPGFTGGSADGNYKHNIMITCNTQ